MPTTNINGTQLYYEIRGRGPSVLLIAGGGLDGGTFDPLGQILAREFTVATYDRRGLSRSPRPEGWSSTSIEEQAEDAAGLLQALGLAPAAVVGNSLGALIALELTLRHPRLVRASSLLDAGPVDSAIPDRRERMPMPEEVRTALTGDGQQARASAFRALLRFLGLWDLLDAGARERMLGNADVFFDLETPLLSSYHPEEALLRANRVPIQVAAGEKTAPVMREMADWLADRLGASLDLVPGGHLAYLEHSDDVADVVRQFLNRVS